MNKIYKLLIESPEYPKGTEAKYDTETKNYDLYLPSGQLIEGEDRNGEEYNAWLHVGQVENRPEIWKLVEEEKEVVENEFRAFIPKYGEKYYFIDHQGNIQSTPNTNDRVDNRNIKQGVYRKERAVRMEVKRRESRAKAWMPEDGEQYYVVCPDGTIRYFVCVLDAWDRATYTDGSCYKTKEDAQKWKDEGYWEAFNCLF